MSEDMRWAYGDVWDQWDAGRGVDVLADRVPAIRSHHRESPEVVDLGGVMNASLAWAEEFGGEGVFVDALLEVACERGRVPGTVVCVVWLFTADMGGSHFDSGRFEELLNGERLEQLRSCARECVDVVRAADVRGELTAWTEGLYAYQLDRALDQPGWPYAKYIPSENKYPGLGGGR